MVFTGKLFTNARLILFILYEPVELTWPHRLSKIEGLLKNQEKPLLCVSSSEEIV